MHLSQPVSLTAAVTLATTCEAFDDGNDADRLRKPRAEVMNVQPESTSARPVVAAVEQTEQNNAPVLELIKAMQERLVKLEERRKPRPKSEVDCFHCKEKGHYRRECPKLKSRQAQAGPSNSATPTNQSLNL